MTHQSQEPIKYYFFLKKKDISWFNCTENNTKKTVIYFYSLYHLHPGSIPKDN